MKKQVSIALAICMMALILSSVTTLASEVDLEALADEIAIVDEVPQAIPFDYSKPIRVGYYTVFTDMVEDLDSLNNKGYGYEIFQKISQISGLEFEFVPVADSMIEAVNSGQVDIGGFNTRSDERREQVLFSETQYSKTYLALMTRDMDVLYADAAAIDGKTVAVYGENMGVDALNSFCEENDISVEYVYADTDEYMNLDTDFYITYSEDPTSSEMNNVLNLGVYSLFLISSFENAELLDTIDSYFMEIVYTEGNYFMELEEKYLADNLEINHRGLTEREIEILRQRPLEVGYVTGFSPVSFTDEQGEPSGSMIDILSNFADTYDFEVNYHPYSISDPLEERENFDILVTLYGEGESEWEHFAITDPYYSMPMYAQINLDRQESVARQDILETSPRIGLLQYQTLDYQAFLQAYPGTEFVFYNSWHELLDSFAAGDLDMLLSTESAATYAELYLEDTNRTTINTEIDLPMVYLINHDIADEYVPIFNIMIDRMSENEYQIIIETNANEGLPDEEISFLGVVVTYWYYFAIGLFIAIVAFVALYVHGQFNKKIALIKSYNTDRLTGLMSNLKFRESLDEILEKARPGEYELISFDIDMFRTINTHFSNERGNAILVAVGEALKKAFEDTSAVLCRRSADQFLILRRVDDGGTMHQIYSTYILPSIQENVNEKYKIALSFGNVIIKDVKEKSDTLVGQADNARMDGKTIHKTTFITFSDEMRKEYDDKINITFRMEQALKDREFQVEYQPKIDFATLKMGGAEALVRWVPKLGGKIYPDEFIPVFETNGFIADLDLYVLEEVCQCLKENKCKMEIPCISVNLSAHTVLSDNIVQRISRITDTYGIKSKRIEFELTESAVEANTALFLERVKQFKKLGFTISIDDFGAGVSSLNRLSAVDADILKLDKAFFDLKDQGAKSTVVVTDIINMAKHLEMKVVAEGVETSAQALWLKGIGCDYAQGYYFEKPMSVEKFSEVLLEKKQYSISLL